MLTQPPDRLRGPRDQPGLECADDGGEAGRPAPCEHEPADRSMPAHHHDRHRRHQRHRPGEVVDEGQPALLGREERKAPAVLEQQAGQGQPEPQQPRREIVHQHQGDGEVVVVRAVGPRGERFRAAAETLDAEIKRLSGAARCPAVIAIHSFTPVFQGFERPWEIGILWDQDDRIPVHSSVHQARAWQRPYRLLRIPGPPILFPNS